MLTSWLRIDASSAASGDRNKILQCLRKRATMSKRGRPHRDILEDLESEGKTLEVLLLAWSIVEMHSTNVLLRVYGLSSQNPKADPLTKLFVARKLRILKKMGLVPDKEFSIVKQFQIRRNGLFHRDGLFFPNYSEQQKSEIRDEAIAAADVAHDMAERALRLPSPYENSD